jgi:hypothetical protein
MNRLLRINNIYFFSAGCIFIYLVLRAALVPPVHDEAATFMHYIQRNEWIPYQAHWDANNHILNSFLSAQFFKIFGQRLISLRLASLLFFPVYVIYTYKISLVLKNKWVRIGMLWGMLGVHNLMEYFAYSRGYAMSMALILAAIFYLINYLQNFQLKKLWPFYIFSCLALVSNLTLFNTVLILNGVVFCSFVLYNRQWLFKLLYLFLGAVPMFAVALLTFEMKRRGLLYYGSNKGFYEVTVWSLVMLIYDNWQPLVAQFFILLSALSVIFLGVAAFPGGIKKTVFSNRWLFAFLFIGNILATLLLQVLLKVNYPEDRTAMYFYFFLVLFFSFALDAVPFKKARYLAFIWMVFPLHFFININTTHSSYWWYEHLPQSFYREIETRAGKEPEKISVGGYVLMDMIWAYYNHQTGGRLNDIQTDDYPSFYYDYLLLYDDNNNAFAQDDYNTLFVSPVSGIRVLERKQKIQLRFIQELAYPDKLNNTDEFISFIDNDTLKKYKNLCVDFTMHFQNNDPFFFGMITLGTNIKNERGPHESQELNLTRTEWKKGYDFHHRIYMQNISAEASRVTVYFWNKRKRPVNLRQIKMKLYTW